jgi:2-phosphosulfolactate phosphatase
MKPAEMDVDVALVPGQTAGWPPTVCVVVDELRASSTLTTALDLGCPEVIVTGSLAQARRLARERGSLLAGERGGRDIPGFDANNSPTQLRAIGVRGRGLVLSTSNGTKVLSRVRSMPLVLLGCLLNARSCAQAAVEEASSRGLPIGIVCAGRRGRFALDDGVAAGLLASRVVEAAEAQGRACQLTDAARAALQLCSANPDAVAALRDSASGRIVQGLGAGADIEFCARTDSSTTVPMLRDGAVLCVERWP